MLHEEILLEKNQSTKDKNTSQILGNKIGNESFSQQQNNGCFFFVVYRYQIDLWHSGEIGRENPSVNYLLGNCQRIQECISSMISKTWCVWITVSLQLLDSCWGTEVVGIYQMSVSATSVAWLVPCQCSELHPNRIE